MSSSRWPSVRVWAALVGLLLSVPLARAAHAADPPEAGQARERERVYQQGVDLAAAGKWSEAVERFRRVVEIRASPKALYTLGEAQEHAGQLVAARASYQASLAAAWISLKAFRFFPTAIRFCASRS